MKELFVSCFTFSPFCSVPNFCLSEEDSEEELCILIKTFFYKFVILTKYT